MNKQVILFFVIIDKASNNGKSLAIILGFLVIISFASSSRNLAFKPLLRSPSVITPTIFLFLSMTLRGRMIF